MEDALRDKCSPAGVNPTRIGPLEAKSVAEHGLKFICVRGA